jgi:hypothetical protein
MTGRHGHRARWRTGRVSFVPSWVGAALLVVWGTALALSGLGLGRSPAALALGTYWPLPFLMLALVGAARPRMWDGGRGFYLVLAAVCLLILAGSVSVPGVNVSNLAWAAVIIAGGIWVAVRARRWWW